MQMNDLDVMEMNDLEQQDYIQNEVWESHWLFKKKYIGCLKRSKTWGVFLHARSAIVVVNVWMLNKLMSGC